MTLYLLKGNTVGKYLLAMLLISFWCGISIGSEISGKVKLDESWEPVVYLSLINSFDDLNTASYDFLIYSAEVDSKGIFKLTDVEIPEAERMYRLHICKKGDPISTIIIGGNDENFIHFIMKNTSSIQITPDSTRLGFKHSLVEGYTVNQTLRSLFEIRNTLQLPPEIPSMQNRQMQRNQVLEKYYSMADTSTNTIIQLLAIYFINESFSSSDQLDIMENVNGGIHLSDTSNPYYKSFVNELNYLKYQVNTGRDLSNEWIIWSGILFLILIIFGLYYSLKKRTLTPVGQENVLLISQLSIQEKRVFELLKEGKSNKEISEELFIEVSTVKSHLNKIYSRLGVKNRKEIVNSQW